MGKDSKIKNSSNGKKKKINEFQFFFIELQKNQNKKEKN